MTVWCIAGSAFRSSEPGHRESPRIQGRAAEHEGRVVTVGQFLLFSTESSDAWLLDTSDQLAVPLARDGDPLTAQIEETDKHFTIAWKGQYRIDGQAFVYNEKESGRIRTILGYPTQLITQQARS